MAESSRKLPVIGIGIVIFNDKNQMLWGKRSYDPIGWSMAGGHLEYGETLEDCAIREALEETNLEIKNIEALTFSENLPIEGKREFHSVSIYIFCRAKDSSKLKNMEPHKCDGWEWFDLDNLPKDLAFNYDPILKNNLEIVKKYLKIN